MEISTDPSFLCADSSLQTSSSVARFLPEEDVSTYPLLSKTPSPPPIHFNHPLRQGTIDLDDASTDQVGDDNQGETSSNSESSGIGMDVQVAGTTTLFNQNVYQHLGKNGEAIQENSSNLHANLNIPITKDAPSFVYWNWPLIRKCTFLCFIAAVIAMVAVVVSMIISLPKTCNPKTVWYKGSVFIEMNPFSLPASQSSSEYNLRELAGRVDHLYTDNIAGIRLNSIFASVQSGEHYHASLLEINKDLGVPQDVRILSEILDLKNLGLVLDLPINPIAHELSQPTPQVNETDASIVLPGDIMRISRAAEKRTPIIDAIQYWVNYGVDGFFIEGLEKFYDDPLLLDNLRMWKKILGPQKVLIVSNVILEKVSRSVADDILKYVDLVTVLLDSSSGAQKLAEQIKFNLDSIAAPGTTPFIQWTLSGAFKTTMSEERSHGYTLASTLLTLMLPGSPSLLYGNQYEATTIDQSIANANVDDKSTLVAPPSPNHFQWITNIIAMRSISPSIYQNAIQKGDKVDPNTSIKISKSENILIVERWYPRRNTFVSISNFGETDVSMDLSDLFYSGNIVVGRTVPEPIYFKEFSIKPTETLIIKLDK